MVTELIWFCFLKNLKSDEEFLLAVLLPTWHAIGCIALRPTAVLGTNPFSILLPGSFLKHRHMGLLPRLLQRLSAAHPLNS